jgi:hypothetical protein
MELPLNQIVYDRSLARHELPVRCAGQSNRVEQGNECSSIFGAAGLMGCNRTAQQEGLTMERGIHSAFSRVVLVMLVAE